MAVRKRLSSAEIARVRRLAAQLLSSSASGKAAAIAELADIFARAAVHLESPAKSVAKRVPFFLSATVPAGTVQAVIRAANERVDRLRAETNQRILLEVRPLLTLSEVAPLLRLTPGVMEKLLIDWEFRRDCGWPQWIAGRWHFHPDAFGLHKPEYFSHLPEREPYPPPSHCRTQPGGQTCT